jgi:hypothetical protein
MLARRFTIVCLITAIFGMVFAILVAQARSGTDRTVTPSLLCVLSNGLPCIRTR